MEHRAIVAYTPWKRKSVRTQGAAIMLKALIARIASTVVAVSVLTSIAYVVAAGTEVTAAASQPATASDQSDSRRDGSLCSERAWPYYDRSCLRDPTNPDGRTREVRVISTDRLLAKKVEVTAAR
jgi:hypothetical protein